MIFSLNYDRQTDIATTPERTRFHCFGHLSRWQQSLLISQNRLKAKTDRPEIQIVKEYGQLPEIECYPGQPNQVFFNSIGNAIEEKYVLISHCNVIKHDQPQHAFRYFPCFCGGDRDRLLRFPYNNDGTTNIEFAQ